MKSISIIILLIFTSPTLIGQGMRNSGANIVIESGATMYIDGDANGKYVNESLAADHGEIDLNGNMYMEGDWENNATSGNVFVTNGPAINGTVEFLGAVGQSISGSRSTTFEKLTINNSSNAGVTLIQPVSVNTSLTLTDGILYTDNTNIISLIDDATSTSGSVASFVDGPFQKTGDDAFVFPLGDNNSIWARLEIAAPSSTTSVFTAQYFYASPSDTEDPGTMNNVSTTEYWTLVRNSGSSEVTPTLYWEDGTRSGIEVLSDLTVAKYYGANWLDETQEGGTSGTREVGNMTARSQSTFEVFTFGSASNASNPLPIELLSFEANVSEAQREVELKWVTTAEINNDYFTIERSINGTSFEELFEQRGAGNSNTNITYHGIDETPFERNSYYRLKQTDFDGQFSYSEVVMVYLEPSASPKMIVYPNPSDQNVIYVDIEGSNANSVMKIEIIDTKGMTVFKQYIDLYGITAEINLDPNLPKGMYHVLQLWVQKDYSKNSLGIDLIFSFFP